MILINLYLKPSSLPGGDVGMLSILMIILSLICTGISLIIVVLFHFLGRALNTLKAVLLYYLIYFGIFGYEILGALFKDWNDPHVQLDLYMLFIALLLLIISVLLAIYSDKNYKTTITIQSESNYL